MYKIHKIGVELEGGWDTAPPSPMHGDGSVSVSRPVVGEVSSEPLASVRSAAAYIRANYPVEVNRSCGFHIHISLRSKLDYMRLMSVKYHEYFKAELHKWGKEGNIKNQNFWDRLGGLNNYCMNEFRADEQAEMTSKGHNRYTQLNFCYKLHGTVENRLFPMFKSVEINISALKKFVSLTEFYLQETFGPEKQIRQEVNIDDDNNENVKSIKETVENDGIERRIIECV